MSSKNNKKNPNSVRAQKILSDNPRGLKAGALARILKITRQQTDSILKHLVSTGSVARVGNRFIDSTNQKNRFTGTFVRKHSGAGTVFIPEKDTVAKISRRQGYNYVSGDTVDILTFPDRSGNLKGTIVTLVERRQEHITGYLKREEHGYVVHPLDSRICHPVIIPQTVPRKANNNVVVIKLYKNEENNRVLRAKIVSILGKRHDFGVQTSIITNKFGIRDEMPLKLKAEAETLIKDAQNKPVSPKRRDLRDLPTVTVDPVNARDFDDALSLITGNDDTKLLVHIADVSHFVPKNSDVNHEAFLRGTTVYLPERAIHMLPEELATDVCSLRPHVDRFAVTVEINIDQQGRILAGDIYESIINSDARLTYQEFLQLSTSDQLLDDPQKNTQKELCIGLADMCRKLLIRRIERGVLDLDMPEPFFELDENGKVCGIHKKKRSIAEQTIEEFMIAANIVVATFLHDKNVPYLRRVHAAPDVTEIAELKAALINLGLCPPENPLDPDQVRILLSGIENNAIRSVASQKVLRAMKRAVYSATETGHFGLALEFYTQFTSPIRRFPDLDVHRSVKAALKIQGYEPPEITELVSKAKLLSEFERRGQEAEWDAQKIEKIRFMKDKIGEIYSGTVTHILEFGAYIELDEPFIDGFIPVSMLNEFYEYHEHKNALIGSETGHIMKPGTPVTVKVELADLDRGMLDFSLISDAEKQ